jgi:hypothetical protein
MRRIDAVEIRHLQVHQDHIRLEGRRPPDGFFAGRSLPDHLHFGHQLKQPAQPVTEEGVIVGDQNADCIHQVILSTQRCEGAKDAKNLISFCAFAPLRLCVKRIAGRRRG